MNGALLFSRHACHFTLSCFTKVQAPVQFAKQITPPALTQCNSVKNLAISHYGLSGSLKS